MSWALLCAAATLPIGKDASKEIQACEAAPQRLSATKWLWGTPVYSAQLDVARDVQDVLVNEITRKYFQINETFSQAGGSPSKLNDAFYGWQQDLDQQWMAARHACFASRGLAFEGPTQEEGERGLHERERCEAKAIQHHWHQLRGIPQWSTVMRQVQDHCQKYLNQVGLRDRESRQSFGE